MNKISASRSLTSTRNIICGSLLVEKCLTFTKIIIVFEIDVLNVH